MRPDPVACAVAFAVAAVVTGVVARLARRAGALDAPDPARRIHTAPTPRLGGIGIAVGLAAGWAVGGTLEPALLAGAALFFAVGFADDVGGRGRGIPAAAKWGAQVVAAAVPVLLGLTWTGGGGAAWPDLDPFGPWTPVMTALWILAVVNVVNFLDGIDGIVAATATVCLGTAALAGASPAAHVHAAGAAAVVGFALWNAPRARIFMGDGGSHLLGFLIASTALGSPAGIGGPSAPAGLPWPLAAAPLLPAILDVVEALVHKARHGIPMSQAHADHLYQRLVKAGRPHGVVALRYGLLSLAAVLLVGPVAARWGLLAAVVPGVALLALHWVTGVRATRHVPRLSRP